MKTLLFVGFTSLTLLCRAEIVTLTVGGSTRSNDVLRIDGTQSAELKGFFESQYQATYLYVENTNNAFWIPSTELRPTVGPPLATFIFRGPATIALRRGESQHAAFATFVVSPEPYRPDKSITIAPGAGGAVITLECSTDLVNWTATTNGIYTNLSAAKFFRIRAERVP
jgi:hypothetical protein